jgi:hypothetical protein
MKINPTAGCVGREDKERRIKDKKGEIGIVLVNVTT